MPEEVNSYFAEMGRIAVDLANNAKDVVQFGDPRKAAQLRHDDDVVDDLQRQLFSLLMDREWKHGVAAESSSKPPGLQKSQSDPGLHPNQAS